jgi:ankyrin repeat protein
MILKKTSPTTINLAQRAWDAKLTLKEINTATKDKLDEEKDSLGFNVLLRASQNCTSEIVEAIINKGVNIDGLTKGNSTALMAAIWNKKWDNVNLLLRKGANATLVDNVRVLLISSHQARSTKLTQLFLTYIPGTKKCITLCR